MKLIDIGHKDAGMKVTFDRSTGMITVLTHGKGDRREVECEHHDTAATEIIRQGSVLGLLELLPCSPTAVSVGNFLEKEIIYDQS